MRVFYKDTRALAVCAMLTALGVLLGGMLKIPAFLFGGYSVKIGFGVLPVILAGVLYGPVYGGCVGALTDFLQAILFPAGAYVPWFTIVGILFGLIPGLFFMKGQKPTFPRLLLSIAIGQVIGSVICNSFLLMALYSMPIAVMIPRAINQVVMIPLYTVLLWVIIPLLRKAKVIHDRG